jgi:hypothetical protein
MYPMLPRIPHAIRYPMLDTGCDRRRFDVNEVYCIRRIRRCGLAHILYRLGTPSILHRNKTGNNLKCLMNSGKTHLKLQKHLRQAAYPMISKEK